MDENGIKMKAHFQIMKICGRRLGGRGGFAEVSDQINIEIYVCLAAAQPVSMCHFHRGGQSGKHNKNFKHLSRHLFSRTGGDGRGSVLQTPRIESVELTSKMLEV